MSINLLVTGLSYSASKVSCVLPTTALAFRMILSKAPLSCLQVFPPQDESPNVRTRHKEEK